MHSPLSLLVRTRRPSSSTPRVSSNARAGVTALVLAASAGLGIFVAKAIGEERFEIAMIGSVGLLALLVFTRLSFVIWCSLLLITSVAGRGLATLLGLPPVVDFLHFPVAIGFAITAATRPARNTQRAPTNWLLGLLLITAASAIANPDTPMRTIFFLLIVGEPLLVIWAITRWGPDNRSVRKVGLVALGLAALQFPIAILQGSTMGYGDPVQGTLTGHDNGHHVLGALFALVLFLSVAAALSGRVSLVRGLMGAGASIWMMLATGSMAIVIIAGAFVALVPLITRKRHSAVQGRAGSGGIGRVLIAALLSVVALTQAAALLPDVYDRTFRLVEAKMDSFPPLEMVQERAETNPRSALLGSGPGTSASRASLLLVSTPEGGPREILRLPPTDLGRELFEATFDPYGGSAERVWSSALGIVGDLGLIGFAGVIVLLVRLWQLSTSSRSWMAAAARTSILAISVLMFVDNWLEYPEFTLPLALLLGIVIADQEPEKSRQA